MALNFEEAMVVELTAIAGLVNKVFPLAAPQKTGAPYVVYTSDDHDLAKGMEGFLASGALHCEVEVYHSTYAGMKALATLVKAEIASWLGATIGVTGPYIQNVTFDNYLPEFYEATVDLHRKVIGFEVYF